MRTLQLSLFTLCGLMTACGGNTAIQSSPNLFPEARVEVRNKEAAEVLKKRPEVILIYARGLCCPSCSIGVRKTVSRLDFVDRDKPSRGVLLDPKHQLVEVSVIEGKTVTLPKLWQAIIDAGYDPITVFRNGDNGIETIDYTGSLP